MIKLINWVLAATLICGASVMTSCKEANAQEDNPAPQVVSEELIRTSQSWDGVELPDDEDAIRGRRVYQPFKDFEYRRDEALMAQNGKWQNIAQVLAQEPQATDCQTMGLTALVTKANQTTQQIANLMMQRQQDAASYQVGEMKAARLNAEACMDELIQYVNALLVVSPDAALEETAQYIQQDFNKVEAQYQQSRKHGKKEDPQPDGGKDDGEGGDVTPVTPEA